MKFKLVYLILLTSFTKTAKTQEPFKCDIFEIGSKLFSSHSIKPAYANLKDTYTRCEAQQGETYRETCGEWYQKYAAEINVPDAAGQIALHVVAKYKSAAPAMLLIENGSLINLHDHNADSPLVIAVRNQARNVAHLLIEKGADYADLEKHQDCLSWPYLKECAIKVARSKARLFSKCYWLGGESCLK